MHDAAINSIGQETTYIAMPWMTGQEERGEHNRLLSRDTDEIFGQWDEVEA
jgi:hypothetical protein